MSAIETMLDKKLRNEVEKLHSDIFVLQNENTSLRQKVEQPGADRQDTIDNVNSAKIQSINNKQYAKRTNFIVYGVKESGEDKEDTSQTVKGIIKDKLNISLKSDDIELSRRLDQRTIKQEKAHSGTIPISTYEIWHYEAAKQS